MASPTDPGRPSWLWIAPLTDHSGYADEARGFLRALERAGQRPAAREHRWRDSDAGLPEADRAMLAAQLSRTPRDPALAVHHYIPGGHFEYVGGAINVARTMFETDSVPAGWVAPLLERDEIWVPSPHNVESFRAAGIPESKLRIVGGTLDFDLIAPGAEPLDLGRTGDETIFLTAFDFSERKGWRTLLRAWARAFHRHDPVRLVLKTGSFERGAEYVRERIDRFLSDAHEGSLDGIAPITVLTETLTPEAMPRLYAAADAFVMSSHGEGWGRPYMEAMAMGLPTIGSRWSGNLAFMDDTTSWLIDGSLVPVPLDADPYYGSANGHHWFEPDVGALVAALRDIAGDLLAARARAAGARDDLIARFGPDVTAATLCDAAQALERHGAHRGSTLVMRGSFGSNASLALVNDRTGEALVDRGWRVRHRGPRGGSLGEDAIGFSHSWPPNFDPVTDGPTVVTLPWEFGAPPADWVEQVNARVDRVWVPSAYVRDGYVAGGMLPGVVEVVPNGVDVARFTPDGPRLDLERRAGCVFLFVGGTIWRKGIDLLLRAWQEAFVPSDDVLLIVKDFGTTSHYHGQTQQAHLRALAERDDIAPILYVDQELPPDALPALYRAADVLVVPYRGEGFCLPALEAMACGVPVIHTAAGPTGEFVAPQAGWALESFRRTIDRVDMLGPLAGEGFVLEAGHDSLVDAMRGAAASEADRAARATAARACSLRSTWAHAAEVAERSLETLEAEALPLARDIAPAHIDGHETVVLFAPDWSREEEWAGVLADWVTSFGPDDAITLAVYVAEDDPADVAGRILERLGDAGHDEDRLPDLALCENGGAGLASLVARATAVLLPPDGRERPELTRRAARVVRGRDDLVAFAAEVHAHIAAGIAAA